ncbi:MAG: hypothetical protein HN704_08340 [Bacteroidetes bacterium]|jgi:hypothetical protein|nr:hypothetical protein [Bacteroidota bacterium]MBT6685536.1 hypothetical protein [Bacteroidota bacterium]MBT7143652.1 hypothetical protein [Bacteroidota bacterium]MBT7491601.1 hypothetical protein [Bacteroidota bacterium]
MKSFILVFISLFLILSISNSCKKCITCEIVGEIIDSTLFFDTNQVQYEEFCGTPSEISAYEADISYLANGRKCATFSILKLPDSSVLSTYTYCGDMHDIDVYYKYVDSILDYSFAGEDAIIDTSLFSNPGHWTCN